MISTVTVLGANGTIGSKMAGLFASVGGLTVYLVANSAEKASAAVEKAVKAFRDEGIRSRLVPSTYEDLPQCLEHSQWLFEAIKEDMPAKLKIHSLAARYRKPGTIVSASTSGLSIEALSKVYDSEGQSLFFGTHFFNPPRTQTLCEIVSLPYSDTAALEALKEFISTRLRRNVISVADSPAFLGNRIGFLFLNEAARFAERYAERGGVDYIDSILGPFTGRSIAPLDTIDFVGLDVHGAIVSNIWNHTEDAFHSCFELPEYITGLIKTGRLGHKVGKGLYVRSPSGILVYDIAEAGYRPVREYRWSFAESARQQQNLGNWEASFECIRRDNSEEAQICLYFLLLYALSGLYYGHTLSDTANAVDTAMECGFGWMTPHRVLELFGGKNTVLRYMQQYDVLRKMLKAMDEDPTELFTV